jgi:hypothetical protein
MVMVCRVRQSRSNPYAPFDGSLAACATTNSQVLAPPSSLSSAPAPRFSPSAFRRLGSATVRSFSFRPRSRWSHVDTSGSFRFDAPTCSRLRFAQHRVWSRLSLKIGARFVFGPRAISLGLRPALELVAARASREDSRAAGPPVRFRAPTPTNSPFRFSMPVAVFCSLAHFPGENRLCWAASLTFKSLYQADRRPTRARPTPPYPTSPPAPLRSEINP